MPTLLGSGVQPCGGVLIMDGLNNTGRYNPTIGNRLRAMRRRRTEREAWRRACSW